MADPARAQRMAKRISSIVASSIAHDIKVDDVIESYELQEKPRD